MRRDLAGNPLDVDGAPLRVGDRILSIRETGVGHEFTIVAFDDLWVRVSGPYMHLGPQELKSFGKYQDHCRLVLDPDIRLDVGL